MGNKDEWELISFQNNIVPVVTDFIQTSKSAVYVYANLDIGYGICEYSNQIKNV